MINYYIFYLFYIFHIKNNDLFLFNIGFGFINDLGFLESYLSPIKFEQTCAYYIGAGIY